MSTRLPGARLTGARLGPCLGAWTLIVLFQFACATVHPARVRVAATVEPGLESATVYVVDFMEPGAVATRPVPIPRAEFQQAFLRLSRDVRLKRKTPREAAHEVLSLLETQPDAPLVAAKGDWKLEQYGGEGFTFIPSRQEGPVFLTPQAEQALKEKYLAWCEHQGGGDCLGLLDDDTYLRTDDRRTLALALAFGNVLDETRAALERELLDVQVLVSMVVWTVALYCMMWVVPEPTTKAVAATLTVILMGYLGLKTVYGLMDGWARMADTAHHATTFEELRTAGEEFGKVLGEDAARAMILAVATLSGHTVGQVVARVKSLPSFNLAGARFEAQGGAAVMGHAEAVEVTLASEGALARAVAAVETVATSPQGPIAVVMLKKGSGTSGTAPGERGSETVLRHRGGNRQVELSNGQRWHLPRGRSAADIPAEDKVGDMLQEAVTEAARKWGPDRLSTSEAAAIEKAKRNGEYWLARLLEREARGRFVHEEVKALSRGRLRFNHQGVDAVDLTTGRQYEILSGTESNLARHGRRMAGEFFRMITF